MKKSSIEEKEAWVLCQRNQVNGLDIADPAKRSDVNKSNIKKNV